MDNAADDITIAHVATQVSGAADAKTVNITKSVLQQVVVDSIETLNITNVSGTSSIASLDADAATTINLTNTAGKKQGRTGFQRVVPDRPAKDIFLDFR